MSIVDPPKKTMTGGEILALPDDGVHRELIRGELRESPMTYRNRTHSRIEADVVFLSKRRQHQTGAEGRVHSGEADFRLRREPETVVGIDVAYASADLVAATDPKAVLYDGGPALAVEILSPSGQHQDVVEKVELYLEVGSMVWVVDPGFRRVRVHRLGQPTETFNDTRELSGEPELPGLRVRVAEFFS